MPVWSMKGQLAEDCGLLRMTLSLRTTDSLRPKWHPVSEEVPQVLSRGEQKGNC
jgi:hypothetical protein